MPSREQTDKARTRDAAAAAAAAAALAVGGKAGVDAATRPLLSPRRVAQAAVRIVALVMAFLVTRRDRDESFLRRELAKRDGVEPDDIAAVIAEERERQVEFERRSEERLRLELPVALSIPDAAERDKAVRGLMGREATYQRQRSMAMAARAFAAIDRVVLRRESPQGAFWQLDPTVQEHTIGCVVGETLVAGPQARRGFRREYAGELVEVVVAAGDVLRITPNHPVLTPTGWRPAGELCEGDEVLRDGVGIKRHEVGVEDPGDVCSIEQVFEAIEQLPAAARASRRVQRLDFHDDFTDAEVRVVATYGGLIRDPVAASCERIREPLLVRGNPALVPGPALRRPLGALLREAPPAQRTRPGLARFAPRGVLFGRHRGDCELHRFAPAAADLDARVEQDALQRAARNGELLGQPLQGMPGVVALDHVVEIRHFDWAGHVYNLSTEGGWYTANGLIAQNCLVMGGRFWPWIVLDRVHPPRHPGCPCRLRSYGAAIAEGLMRPGEVMDVADALRAAQGVVMEGKEVAVATPDEELREALVRVGLTTSETFDSVLADASAR